MVRRRSSPLDALLGRLEDLDAASLAGVAQRLARERALLETVVNSIREGILVLDADGAVSYANAAAQHLLGMDPGASASLGKLIPELRGLDLGALAAGGPAGLSRELDLAYPEARTVRLYLCPLPAVAPPPRRPARRPASEPAPAAQFAVILADITGERARTERQLESERANSILLLAAGVAHELGNPLNSLTIQLQLLQRQARRLAPGGGRERLDAGLEACLAEVRRLDTIITHFLGAVRPQPPNFVELDLWQPLEETLAFLAPELAGAGITVDAAADGPLPPVAADPAQVKQAFFNVLKNACEAMESAGTLRVRAGADDRWVSVLVGDEGGGIEPGNLARVFQPYFTTKAGGHGLGMMIVQRILRDHGGRVALDSAPGRGTIVTLQFPRRHPSVPLLAGDPAPTGGSLPTD